MSSLWVGMRIGHRHTGHNAPQMDGKQSRPPSVESVLALVRPRLDPALEPTALVAATRDVQADERERLGAGAAPRTTEALADEVADRLTGFAGPEGSGIISVINATGVIVHTNLGRAAWPQVAIDAAARAAAEPLLLELDRGSGKRGRRYRTAEEHLIALTGADDALVTNNNAAAVALSVGLARRRGVLVSRGELVEIGGGVRIPEIVRRAGARLVEVGTTNRTRSVDYEEPLVEGRASLILRVHRSNFRQEGFVESPDPAGLAILAQHHEVPLIDDLGSGALLDTAVYGLSHEPTPRERLDRGADVVTFSGDKLLGGPQAGLIAGRADLIARMRRDPLARAMRPDKATLAAVAATLGIYRAGRATLDIPVWRFIVADTTDLHERAQWLVAGLRVARLRVADPPELIETEATIGGGALPGETLPSVAIRIGRGSASRLLASLRRGDPCVVGRVHDDAVILDLRTVAPAQDEALGTALAEALGMESA